MGETLRTKAKGPSMTPPAGQRWTRVVRENRTTELIPLTPNEATE